MAHELNNPLGAVLGFAELLARDTQDERTQRYVQRIVEGAKRASNIVKSLLIFARKHESSKTNINVNHVIESVLSLYGHQFNVENISVQKNLG
ncbi:MAG: histidine kinase dimerization/phospho-acceptor domain-containing protein, partial [Candidatus Kryptoniota bacterium]